MKIISDYKDFYDRIAWNFGGGDPKIPYVRIETNLTIQSNQPLPFFHYNEHRNILHQYKRRYHQDKDPFIHYEFRWLVFLGRYFLLVRHNGKDKIFNKIDHPDIWERLEKLKEDKWYHRYRDNIPFRSVFVEDCIDYKDDFSVQLSKEISLKADKFVPIYIVNFGEKITKGAHRYWLSNERNPNVFYQYEIKTGCNLLNVGFASIQSAEQTYQEIESYIVNVLRVNPDLTPPAKVEDKHRIIQHGFDMKQSFRHRK